jgi:hypothetical protein
MQDKEDIRRELLAFKFLASLRTMCFDEAYTAMMNYPDKST